MNDMIKLQDLMQEGVYDPGILKAVFLAGGPGSGKTTTTNQLFGITFNSLSYTGLKPVNSDKFFEFLLKANNLPTDLAAVQAENPTLFAQITGGGPGTIRTKAKELSTTNYLNYLQGRLGLLIDGTGDDSQRIITQAKELASKFGYDVHMIFVNTPLDVALARNDRRSRKLPHDIVTDSWNKAQKAMQDYKSFFGANFIEIINDKDVRPGQPIAIDPQLEKQATKFASRPVQNPIGKEWIKQALDAKKLNEATFDSPYNIYCDMDGVLCDFVKQWKKFYGEDPKTAKKLNKQKFDEMLNNAPFEFWSTMEWMPGAQRMWKLISKYGAVILTSPADSRASIDGKRAWVQKNAPSNLGFRHIGQPILFEKSYNKQKHAAPDAILIDDYKRNIDQWKASGGIEIRYLNADQVIRDLAKLDIV